MGTTKAPENTWWSILLTRNHRRLGTASERGWSTLPSLERSISHSPPAFISFKYSGWAVFKAWQWLFLLSITLTRIATTALGTETGLAFNLVSKTEWVFIKICLFVLMISPSFFMPPGTRFPRRCLQIPSLWLAFGVQRATSLLPGPQKPPPRFWGVCAKLPALSEGPRTLSGCTAVWFPVCLLRENIRDGAFQSQRARLPCDY